MIFPPGGASVSVTASTSVEVPIQAICSIDTAYFTKRHRGCPSRVYNLIGQGRYTKNSSKI